MFKKAGRPYLLDSNLMKNVEDIAFRTRAARVQLTGGKS